MKNTVVIKSNKSGMTVILDPEIPFEQLVSDVADKFGSSAKFWGSVQMTLTLSGRELAPEEEFRIVNTITGNSQIEVLCLLDQDLNRTRRCEKALNEKLMEISAATGQFYRGNLRSGETIDSETSIVVIGDVEEGARIVSKGNIVVLGDLYGSVHAGISGNEYAVAAAFEMAPSSLKIADFEAKCPGKGKRLAKGPVMVSVRDGELCIESMKKSFFHR